jgi:CheY-like chemotaxis protein
MRILVVDDHHNTRESLALGLTMLQLQVETAASAHAALAALAARPPDWLVCDVRMPAMGGIDLAERARLEHPQIRIVLMTAYDVTGDERRRIADLGAELLIKPVTADRIAARCAGDIVHGGLATAPQLFPNKEPQ